MNSLDKYVKVLENDREYFRNLVTDLRSEIDFWRGKVERLELAIMSNPPAQQEYVQTQVVVKPAIKDVKTQPPMPPPKIPFSDLKRQWAAMSAEDQEKALKDGWEVEKPKEEVHEG